MRLDGQRLGAQLAANAWVRRLEIRDEVDSTNDVLRLLAVDGAPEGTVVIADRQSAGRGRRGHSWWSPPGLGLYLSALVRPEGTLAHVTRWTLVASVAACSACRDLAACDVTIRWPNDLVRGPRKLGGILCEMRSGGGRQDELIVGIGINAFHEPQDFPPELQDRATSLRAAGAAVELQRETLAAAVLNRFAALAHSLRDGDWTAVTRRWLDLSPQAFGAPVRVLPAQGEPIDAETDGIGADGELIVRLATGESRALRGVDAVVFRGG